ncbi:MAG: GDP-mannose 4,6-dehydratase [Deltaproteobacteria bacterium]|nr:GDP-mannose 4,6-dehydratase [Deltaproteobacteria bacterium]
MARVLVTGLTGQIGSFLGERLRAGGHTALDTSGMIDADGVAAELDRCGELDAIVHLAGRSSVGESWGSPMATFDDNARLTAAFAYAAQTRGIVFVNASSAEIFGNADGERLTETSPIAPVSPYGVAKAAGHTVVRLTRDQLGARATNLIFFLGESIRRAETFVVRKITRGLARVKLGQSTHVTLGNTAVIRDFCHADDFARAAEMFALGAAPGDYVVASGDPHSIDDVARTCCELLDLDPAAVIKNDQSLVRRADIARLVGDSSRLRALGWAPSASFRELLAQIVEHDLAQARLAT